MVVYETPACVDGARQARRAHVIGVWMFWQPERPWQCCSTQRTLQCYSMQQSSNQPFCSVSILIGNVCFQLHVSLFLICVFLSIIFCLISVDDSCSVTEFHTCLLGFCRFPLLLFVCRVLPVLQCTTCTQPPLGLKSSFSGCGDFALSFFIHLELRAPRAYHRFFK